MRTIYHGRSRRKTKSQRAWCFLGGSKTAKWVVHHPGAGFDPRDRRPSDQMHFRHFIVMKQVLLNLHAQDVTFAVDQLIQPNAPFLPHQRPSSLMRDPWQGPHQRSLTTGRWPSTRPAWKIELQLQAALLELLRGLGRQRPLGFAHLDKHPPKASLGVRELRSGPSLRDGSSELRSWYIARNHPSSSSRGDFGSMGCSLSVDPQRCRSHGPFTTTPSQSSLPNICEPHSRGPREHVF